MRFLLLLLILTAQPVFAEDADSTDAAPITKTLVWPDGTRYVGGVVDGKRSGKGTIFWQDGTRFVGQFEDDMRNGPGTMILPDGTVYTGFFRNDELVDTQSTLAASNAAEMDDSSTSDALGDTELPMEADSLAAPTVSEQAADQAEEAVENESLDDAVAAAEDTAATVSDTADLDDDIASEEADDTSLAETDDSMLATEDEYSLEDPYSSDITEVTTSVEMELEDTINLWAAAWSEQNVPQYLSNYSADFDVPGRQTRSSWEALRRTRLNRPSYINIDIDFQRFELVEANVVDVFFRQSYRSNTYSDLTDKVLRMRKEGTDWMILFERSR